MNVMLVTTISPFDRVGGVGTMVKTLAEGLNKSGHNAQLMVRDWNCRRMKTEVHNGVDVTRFRLRSPGSQQRQLTAFVAFIVFLIPTILRLITYCRKNRIDVCHLHYASDTFIYFAALRVLLGQPYVITFHRGDIINFDRKPIVARAAIWCIVRAANCVTAVSEEMAGLVRERFNRSVVTIPNGVNSSMLCELASAGENVQGIVLQPYLVSVANVSHYKGIDVLIEAWAQLKADVRRQYRMYVVGEPREAWSECSQQIAKNRLEEQVILLGAQEYATTIKILAKATCAVFPSRSEGLPYALLEAGILSVPVVCSKIPSYMEVVSANETALLFENEDASGLAKAIECMLACRESSIERATRLSQLINKKYSAAAMTHAYLVYYQSVVNGFRNYGSQSVERGCVLG